LERIIWLENGDQNEVIELAISLEGHPDNVVPAMLGCRLAATGLINDPRRRERKREEFW